jgi:hypothetical protein
VDFLPHFFRLRRDLLEDIQQAFLVATLGIFPDLDKPRIWCDKILVVEIPENTFSFWNKRRSGSAGCGWNKFLGSLRIK